MRFFARSLASALCVAIVVAVPSTARSTPKTIIEAQARRIVEGKRSRVLQVLALHRFVCDEIREIPTQYG